MTLGDFLDPYFRMSTDIIKYKDHYNIYFYYFNSWYSVTVTILGPFASDRIEVQVIRHTYL